jgi:DNA-binding IscR family transcriptional regulator
MVYRRIDDVLFKTLQETSLQDLVSEAEKNDPSETYMYYI